MKNTLKQFNLMWLFSFMIVASGCSTNLVAPYDPQIRMMLVRSSVEIEDFWQQMQQTPVAERQYSHFSERYQKINLDLKTTWKISRNETDQKENFVLGLDGHESEVAPNIRYDEDAKLIEKHFKSDYVNPKAGSVSDRI